MIRCKIASGRVRDADGESCVEEGGVRNGVKTALRSRRMKMVSKPESAA